MNRIRAGYALSRNPMNSAHLSRIPLTPDVIDCIVFWTKDAQNMLHYLPELDRPGYKYCFLFTLTPYGRDIEPGLRDKADIESTFIELSKLIGKERVVWRYDPVILNGTLDIAYHKAHFERLCDSLAGYTNSVIISFVDMYPKLKTSLVREVTDDEIAELSAFIGKTAKEHNLLISACCENADLTRFGIKRTGCINKAWIEAVCGYRLDIPQDKNQRKGCGCVQSIDIGTYNTCPAGCVYCYANNGSAAAHKRHSLHDPESGLLYGSIHEGEKINDRNVKSNKILK